MIFISSLFTLLLRLFLSVQGSGEVVSLDWSTLIALETPVSTSIAGEQLKQPHDSIQGIEALFSSIEVEEKEEVEPESNSEDLLLHSYKFIQKNLLSGFLTIFGNKAIRGSSLPLYDFYHTWKIHLS